MGRHPCCVVSQSLSLPLFFTGQPSELLIQLVKYLLKDGLLVQDIHSPSTPRGTCAPPPPWVGQQLGGLKDLPCKVAQEMEMPCTSLCLNAEAALPLPVAG